MFDFGLSEIPTFLLMKKKLKKSLIRDEKILRFILNSHQNILIKRFSYKVKITKKKYMQMIKNRYISILLNLKLTEILKGIDEINLKYKQKINFKDKLICIILKK